MRKLGFVAVFLSLMLVAWTVTDRVMASSKSNNIALVDDCLPGDPGWNPTGGCLLKPSEGDVSFAEFNLLLTSTLGGAGYIVGHPSWRIEPSYLSIEIGTKNRVKLDNLGGRVHTFTELANFGGGVIPPLNGSLSPAPECLAGVINIAPGERHELGDLEVGLHKFQCCIHPWMRSAIRVNPK